MSFNPTSPVTGAAQTGLTAPTYTLTADVAPGMNGKQFAVTALGGTQTGVSTHSVASPFTHTFWRPLIAKLLGNPNTTTGVISNVPRNTYKFVTRKGVVPLAGQPVQVATITTVLDIPAGSDLADSEDLRAALSAHFGIIAQQSAGIGDTVVSGIM